MNEKSITEEYSSKITSKGQVTIPVAIRNALNLDTGDRISFTVSSDNKVYISKKNDEILERILFTLDFMKDSSDLILISGSNIDSRRQLVEELILKDKEKYTNYYVVTEIQNPYLHKKFKVLTPYNFESMFDEEDFEYDVKNIIVFWETEYNYNQLRHFRSANLDLILCNDELNFADFAEENDSEHDYEDDYIINSEFKTLEIKLDRLGNHLLSYYVVEENEIIKTQKLFGWLLIIGGRLNGEKG